MRIKLIFAIALLITAASLLRSQMPTSGVTGRCTHQQALIFNSSTNTNECQSVTLVYRATGLNTNQTNTDIGSFTGLPARYIVRRLTVDNASATPTLSTVSLRTATGGGGTAIVNAQALSTLTAATTFLDSTLAVTTSVQTASTLTIRAVRGGWRGCNCGFHS